MIAWTSTRIATRRAWNGGRPRFQATEAASGAIAAGACVARALAAFRTFSNARASICRMRSRDTLKVAASSSKCLRFVGQKACLEDAPFAAVEYIDRGNQCLVLAFRLVLFNHDGFR